ncbi:hypothetical protein DRI50_08840 [candidate division KSB1 bacterium]|nr:MAG: hypothetical protein DRI50_08840 [candidate division KSB1 bacterium]
MAKILAIDDDPYFLFSLSNFLTFKKHNVTTVQNPYRAKEIIRDENFDCLLMDIQMPGVNGYELMKYTRQLRPALPVIIISGLSYSKNFEELSKYKNVKFIEKPFNPLILLEMIERLIASKEPD